MSLHLCIQKPNENKATRDAESETAGGSQHTDIMVCTSVSLRSPERMFLLDQWRLDVGTPSLQAHLGAASLYSIKTATLWPRLWMLERCMNISMLPRRCPCKRAPRPPRAQSLSGAVYKVIIAVRSAQSQPEWRYSCSWSKFYWFQTFNHKCFSRVPELLLVNSKQLCARVETNFRWRTSHINKKETTMLEIQSTPLLLIIRE